MRNWAVLTAVCTLASCGPAPTPEPRTMNEIVGGVQGALTAQLDEGDLLATAKVAGPIAAGEFVERLGKALQRQRATDAARYKGAVLAFKIDATDRLGRPYDEDLFVLEYSLSDLQAAEFDNLSSERVLNLAAHVEPGSALGAKVSLEWCNESEQRARSPFCRAMTIETTSMLSAGQLD